MKLTPKLWKAICFTQESTSLNVNLSTNTLTETSKIMFDDIAGHSSPAKLTHKIIHHHSPCQLRESHQWQPWQQLSNDQRGKLQRWAVCWLGGWLGRPLCSPGVLSLDDGDDASWGGWRLPSPPPPPQSWQWTSVFLWLMCWLLRIVLSSWGCRAVHYHFLMLLLCLPQAANNGCESPLYNH